MREGKQPRRSHFRYGLGGFITAISLVSVVIFILLNTSNALTFQRLEFGQRTLKLQYLRTGTRTYRVSFQILNKDKVISSSEAFELYSRGKFCLVQFDSESGIAEFWSRAGYTFFIEIETGEFAVFGHLDPFHPRDNRVKMCKSPAKSWAFWAQLPRKFVSQTAAGKR